MTQAQVLIGAAARGDIALARDWYAELDVPGLQQRFLRELDATLGRIEAFPLSFQIVYKDVRRATLHRFPYSVFFRLRNGQPFVLAVLHHARDPRAWKRR